MGVRLRQCDAEEFWPDGGVGLDAVDAGERLPTNLTPHVFDRADWCARLRIHGAYVQDPPARPEPRPLDLPGCEHRPISDGGLGLCAWISHRGYAVREQDAQRQQRQLPVDLRAKLALLIRRMNEDVRVQVGQTGEYELAAQIDDLLTVPFPRRDDLGDPLALKHEICSARGRARHLEHCGAAQDHPLRVRGESDDRAENERAQTHGAKITVARLDMHAAWPERTATCSATRRHLCSATPRPDGRPHPHLRGERVFFQRDGSAVDETT